MRTIEIQGNEKLINLLKMKAELNDEWIKLDKEKVELEEKKNKIALKINRLNDKAQPLYRDSIKDIELVEFEEHSRMFIDEKDGKLKLDITNVIDEFKEVYRQKKEELLKKQNESGAGKDNNTKSSK